MAKFKKSLLSSGIQIHIDLVSLLTMSYAYHLAGNSIVLIVLYLLVYKYLSPSIKIRI